MTYCDLGFLDGRDGADKSGLAETPGLVPGLFSPGGLWFISDPVMRRLNCESDQS